MGQIIRIKGDFRDVDPAQLEQFLKSLVEQSTGEPVQRVVFNGVMKQDFDATLDAMAGG